MSEPRKFRTYKTGIDITVDENFWMANPNLGVASMMGAGALMNVWFSEGPPADDDKWMIVAIEEAETVILKLVELELIDYNVPPEPEPEDQENDE